MNKLLAKETGVEFENLFVSAAIKAFEDYQVRVGMDPGLG